MLRLALAPALALSLASCGSADDARGAGGVTAGEARALDEAAEMLEERRLPPEAFEPAPTPSPEASPQP